jgi:uncharacterized protein YodC (DUF2158 family)
MPNIKKGDVVQLKSGGPHMTVQQTNDESAECVWFSGYEDKSAWFDLASLEVVES